MKTATKNLLKQKRRWRVRKKISGTSARPRLNIHFSGKHIYAQCIDDEAGKTIAYLSSLAKDLKEEKLTANIESARRLGKLFGEKAKSASIEKVVFDRGDRRYHGRIREFANATREAGLQF
ncbi:MAG: 50S ribosomal protein L18 [Opitutales bacterium]